MSRAIDADALEKEGWSLHRTIRVDKNTSEYQTKPLRKVPTIEPRCEACEAFNKTRLLIPQPQRKRGKWIYGEDNPGTGRDGWFCSKCGHFELWDYSADMKSAELNLPNYCPNCGADMRGEQDEAD